MEKRLIDADKRIAEIKKLYCDGCDNYGGTKCRACWVDDAMCLIDDATTVDAVPVVRCRECKYWGDEDGKLQDSDGVLFARCKVHNYLIDGRHTGWCPTENDFCSYGERKEGDGCDNYGGTKCRACWVDDAMCLIDDATTVDAVPVVRCRECKYWGDEDGKLQDSDGVLFARCKVHNYLIDGRHTGWCPTENDFCSYGERKEGDD